MRSNVVPLRRGIVLPPEAAPRFIHDAAPRPLPPLRGSVEPDTALRVRMHHVAALTPAAKIARYAKQERRLRAIGRAATVALELAAGAAIALATAAFFGWPLP